MREKNRKSNIELLRIVAMLGIIAHHYVYNGGGWDQGGDNARIISSFLVSGGSIGNNIFFLIMGYCSFQEHDVDWLECRLLKICSLVWSYSWGLLFIFFLTTDLVNNKSEIIKSIFPICNETYWFFSTYFVILLCSLVINKRFLRLSQITYRKLVIFFLVILSGLSTLGFDFPRIIWGMYVYILGAFIRKSVNVTKENKKLIKAVVLFLVCYIMSGIANYMMLFIGEANKSVWDHRAYFFKLQGFPMVITSLCLFYLFINLDIPYSFLINKIGGVTGGIYLLHTNLWIKKVLYTNLLHCDRFLDNKYYCLIAVASITGIFLTGVIIELGRKYLEKYFKLFVQYCYIKYFKKYRVIK